MGHIRLEGFIEGFLMAVIEPLKMTASRSFEVWCGIVLGWRQPPQYSPSVMKSQYTFRKDVITRNRLDSDPPNAHVSQMFVDVSLAVVHSIGEVVAHHLLPPPTSPKVYWQASNGRQRCFPVCCES